jgi:hypothetical protein
MECLRQTLSPVFRGLCGHTPQGHALTACAGKSRGDSSRFELFVEGVRLWVPETRFLLNVKPRKTGRAVSPPLIAMWPDQATSEQRRQVHRRTRGRGVAKAGGTGPADADRPAALGFLTMTTRPSFRAPVEADFKLGAGGRVGGRHLYGPLDQHLRPKRGRSRMSRRRRGPRN